MIQASLLAHQGGVSISVFDCDGGRRAWSSEEESAEFTLMLVGSGTFRRWVDGVEMLADPMVAYLEHPGAVQRFAHPAGGDICTGIGLSEAALDSITNPAAVRSDGIVHLTDVEQFAHRLLLRRFRAGTEPDHLIELALLLAGRVLAKQTVSPVAGSANPAAVRLAETVREAIGVQPDLTLQGLAAALALPAYHVSRAFKAVTRQTVSEYRTRVRARIAIERLAEGETNLAGLAADAGFSDQAHMTRTLRSRMGLTPRGLRDVLR